MAAEVLDLEAHRPSKTAPQSAEKQKRLGMLLEKLNEYEVSRRPLDIEWALNIYYYLGFQAARYDFTAQRFVLDRTPSRKARVIVNKMRENLHKRRARFVRQRPDWGVIPSTADPEDEVRAQGDRQFLQYLARAQRLDRRYSTGMLWVVTTGNCPTKTYWDQELGPFDTRPMLGESGRPKMVSRCPACRGLGTEDGNVLEIDGEQIPLGPPCPVCEGQGGEIQMEPYRQGDAAVRVKSPFDVWFDPNAAATEDCEGVLERDLMSVQEVRRRFTEEGGRITRADTTYNSGVSGVAGINQLYSGLISLTYGTAAVGGTTPGRVEVFTYYSKPTTKHPKGYVDRFSREVYLEGFDFPEPELGTEFGYHPFVNLIDFEIPGSCYGQAVASDARNLQQTLNMLWSQILEHGKMTVSPPILQGLLAVVTGDDGYPQSGRKIKYNPTVPGGKPEFMVVPSLPDVTVRLLPMLAEAIRDIHLVQQQGPESEVTGRLLALLDEQQDKYNTPQIVANQDAMCMLARRALHCAKKYTGKTRSFAILGRGSRGEYGTLEPYSSPIDSVDVTIVPQRGVPDSPLARAEYVKDMAPFIVDPETGKPDHQRILEILDQQTDSIDRNRQERENAIRENRRMVEMVGGGGAPGAVQVPQMDGTIVWTLPVSPHDNHLEHINQHKREAWMFDVGDPRRLVIEAHLDPHMQFFAQAQGAVLAMSQQQIAGGSPPQQPFMPGQTMPSGDLGAPGAMDAAAGAQMAGPQIARADRTGEQSARAAMGAMAGGRAGPRSPS